MKKLISFLVILSCLCSFNLVDNAAATTLQTPPEKAGFHLIYVPEYDKYVYVEQGDDTITMDRILYILEYNQLQEKLPIGMKLLITKLLTVQLQFMQAPKLKMPLK